MDLVKPPSIQVYIAEMDCKHRKRETRSKLHSRSRELIIYYRNLFRASGTPLASLRKKTRQAFVIITKVRLDESGNSAEKKDSHSQTHI
jgi:hypothetical protein